MHICATFTLCNQNHTGKGSQKPEMEIFLVAPLSDSLSSTQNWYTFAGGNAETESTTAAPVS